ncbi:MAG: hypothetical protein ACLTSX_03720 [Collinsella sp.]
MGPDDANNYNVYRIYRPHVAGGTNAVVRNGVGGRETLASAVLDEGAGTLNTGLDRYDVDFFELVNCYDQNVASSGAAGDDDTKWVGVKDAIRLGAAGTGFQEPLGVYASPAKAVLMLDTAQTGRRWRAYPRARRRPGSLRGARGRDHPEDLERRRR